MKLAPNTTSGNLKYNDAIINEALKWKKEWFAWRRLMSSYSETRRQAYFKKIMTKCRIITDIMRAQVLVGKKSR